MPGRPVRAVDRLYSRARAIEHARELAAAERAAEIVVERRDGIVEMTLAA